MRSWKKDVEVAKMSGDDYRQMPGVFVIDRKGVIRYAHRNKDVADNPPNDELLDALGAIRARRSHRDPARSATIRPGANRG